MRLNKSKFYRMCYTHYSLHNLGESTNYSLWSEFNFSITICIHLVSYMCHSKSTLIKYFFRFDIIREICIKKKNSYCHLENLIKAIFNMYKKKKKRKKKGNGTPLLIPVQIIVEKWKFPNQHAFFSTSIWCLKVCLRGPSTWSICT